MRTDVEYNDCGPDAHRGRRSRRSRNGRVWFVRGVEQQVSKRSGKVAVPVMLVAVALCGVGIGAMADGNKLTLRDVRLQSDGILEMSVQIALERPGTLFSWKGDLYPLLGHGLFVEVRDVHVEVGTARKFMPEIVHHSQIVRARVYTYPKVLLLQLTPKDDEELPQCITFRLVYDTTRLRCAPVELKRMTIESEWISVCQGAARRGRTIRRGELLRPPGTAGRG